MKENNTKFTLPNTKEFNRYLEAMFALSLVKMITNYGVKFKIDKKISKELKKIIKSNQELFVKNSTYKLIENKEHIEVIFLGGIRKEYLDIFNNKGIYLDFENMIIIKNIINNKINKNINQNVELIGNYIYYSGVLPRLKKIKIYERGNNLDVKTLELIIERATFAMTDCFDNIGVINHPYLKEYKSLLLEFFKNEDQLRDNLYKKFDKYPDKEIFKKIRFLNRNYLSKSTGTNSIAVSGNIVTKDNRLIMSVRNSESIDNGEIYCSVNGQSEIIDSSVDIYKRSVKEDFPTIDINSKFRKDFEGELNRETKAELNIKIKDNWEYNGISILGINNDKNINKRRMHFNIIAHNTTHYNFYDVIEQRKSATEKFENSKLIGLKVELFKNRFHYLGNRLMSFLKFISNHETEVLFIFAIFSVFKNGFYKSINIELILGMIIILTFITDVSYKIIKYKNYRENIKKIRTYTKDLKIFSGDKDKSYHKINKKIESMELNNFNVIEDLMFYLYIRRLNK